jgi:hypothetical protein
MARRPIVAVALLALILAGAALVYSSTARAQPIGGATYTGSHSRGGTVELTVSEEGDFITSFTINDLADEREDTAFDNGCPSPVQLSNIFIFPNNHSFVSFSFGEGALIYVSGFFGGGEGPASIIQNGDGVSGTFFYLSRDPRCVVNVSWSASADFVE